MRVLLGKGDPRIFQHNIALDFFQTEDGFSYHPWRHWAFLGEIVNAESLFHLRLLVKDRRDQHIPIAFYTSQVGREITPEMLKPGCTVVVLYAENLSLSLENLFLLSDKIQRFSTVLGEKRTCHGCNRKFDSLMKCAKCNFFWYCNKDCQTRGWKENGHKSDCRLLQDPDLQGLFLLKFDAFEEYLSFPLRLEN
ncbi:hypothetical protein HZ326_29643 [Fusarium oxysporum f. sp. albedinis]|nr:hypothetical protein HZ326_29643 [Fusarium oxysporum f. sp. albedinis]